jgi:hypothetical protein
LTYDETVAQLRERGLPPELIKHLRKAPEADALWPGENPDPLPHEETDTEWHWEVRCLRMLVLAPALMALLVIWNGVP